MNEGTVEQMGQEVFDVIANLYWNDIVTPEEVLASLESVSAYFRTLRYQDQTYREGLGLSVVAAPEAP